MPVNIRGKEYKTVAERVAEFRAEYHLEYAILTEIVSAAEVVQVKASISNKDGFIVATGFAEEVRGSTNINKTSALENCETSAVGRALAAFGLGGTEYATANEVTDAIIQQSVMDAKQAAMEFYNKQAQVIRDNWLSIVAIKQAISEGEIEYAKECYGELSEDEQKAIWVAPSKGGIFTTEERKAIKEG
jgi:deoxycytidylate deaminase